MGEFRVPFDIRQLRYAIAAADHRSFYRAARALDIEQSTLSRTILKLEHSLGMPIFERSRTGVTMTLAGTDFIRGAKPMVATAEKLVAMMREFGQGRSGGLRARPKIELSDFRGLWLTGSCEDHEDHMGWTETARREHDRSGLRYASDCTDDEWAVVRPLLRRTTKVGRRREYNARTLWDAIQYIAATGCWWAQLPKDFPPFTTVEYHFYRMRDNGLLDVVNAVLVAWVRVAEGRDPTPTAAIIDSQSVKTTEAGGPRGYVAGKKIKGRKRHIVTDTLGNTLKSVVHGCNVQDRDGAPGPDRAILRRVSHTCQAVRR